MRGDLTVRINDGERDRHVTGAVRDLRFRKTAPGGHHSASMRLVLPRGTFRDLGPADKVYIYDGTTARTIWEGYTENPGITDGPQGEEYDLSAMGGMVLASDESRKLIYLDRDLERWERDPVVANAASASVGTATDPSSAYKGPVVLCQLTPGQPIGTGSRAQVAYRSLVDAGMELGAVGFNFDGGKVDAGYKVEGSVGADPTYLTIPFSTTLSDAASSKTLYIGADFPSGTNILSLRLIRTGGATNVADDNTWALFYEVRVLGRRVNKYGTAANSLADMGNTSTYVYAHHVAEDLLGRVLKTCDPTASMVATVGTFQIDQLAYHDGATAQEILADLSLYEPDLLWEILHSTSAGHVFNYRAWPTTPRYEISVKDGYSAPGGDEDLCNRIAVYWTNVHGKKMTTDVTQYVEALGSRIRDAEPITLPEGLGSEANAQRIGQQVLAAKAKPPKSATATVRRPIVDHLTGSMVMPWEIEPGYLVRVRETGDDLRLTEMEYVDSDGAATLTLGEPTLTIEQRIARLSNRR